MKGTLNLRNYVPNVRYDGYVIYSITATLKGTSLDELRANDYFAFKKNRVPEPLRTSIIANTEKNMHKAGIAIQSIGQMQSDKSTPQINVQLARQQTGSNQQNNSIPFFFLIIILLVTGLFNLFGNNPQPSSNTVTTNQTSLFNLSPNNSETQNTNHTPSPLLNQTQPQSGKALLVFE